MHQTILTNSFDNGVIIITDDQKDCIVTFTHGTQTVSFTFPYTGLDELISALAKALGHIDDTLKEVAENKQA